MRSGEGGLSRTERGQNGGEKEGEREREMTTVTPVPLVSSEYSFRREENYPRVFSISESVCVDAICKANLKRGFVFSQ